MLTTLRAQAAILLRDRKGVTAMEYGLIAAFTAVAIVAGLTVIGPKLTTIFNDIGAALP